MTNGWSCTEMVTNKESMYAYIIATTQLSVFEKNTPQRLYTMVAMKLNR